MINPVFGGTGRHVHLRSGKISLLLLLVALVALVALQVACGSRRSQDKPGLDSNPTSISVDLGQTPDRGPSCPCIQPKNWIGFASCECSTIAWGCSAAPQSFKACNVPPTCWTTITDPVTGCPRPAKDSGCLGSCKGGAPDLIGRPCTATGGECGAAHTCLLTSPGPSLAPGSGQGVCTVQCTPDNPGTPTINEDTCPDPAATICGTVDLLQGGKANYCLLRCTPRHGANDCIAPLSCDVESAALAGLQEVGQAVCMKPGCTSNDDCPVRTNIPCVIPTPKSAPCPAGLYCAPERPGAAKGLCSKAGTCEPKSGLCAAHKLGQAAAKVGDPCQDDTACGAAMRCLMQLDEAAQLKAAGEPCGRDDECCSERCSAKGVCAAGACTLLYRNGYCTVVGCLFAGDLTQAACPGGSTCNRLYPGGLCQRICDPVQAGSCRGHAKDQARDYECRAWNNKKLVQDKVPTDAPVCDFGTRMPCSYFKGKNGDCKLIGVPSNTTDMACRDDQGSQTLDAFSPVGYCLDKTASGS